MSKKTMIVKVKSESVKDFLSQYTRRPIPLTTTTNFQLNGSLYMGNCIGTTITMANPNTPPPPPPVEMNEGYYIDIDSLKIGTEVKFQLEEVGSISKEVYQIELTYIVEEYDDINSKLIKQK
jgi:hypothetical protein